MGKSRLIGSAMTTVFDWLDDWTFALAAGVMIWGPEGCKNEARVQKYQAASGELRRLRQEALIIKDWVRPTNLRERVGG